MKSAFLLGILEFLLSKGLGYIEAYTVEKEAEVEKFIKDLVPGEDFDELAWGFVKNLLPTMFEVAKDLIDKIDGVEGDVRKALLFQAVSKLAR